MSFDKKIIGERIAHLRKEKNMTQEELAEKVKITVQYLGTIERGKANTTLNRLDMIADVLGCPSTELILGTDPLDNAANMISSDPELENLIREMVELQHRIIKKLGI